MGGVVQPIVRRGAPGLTAAFRDVNGVQGGLALAQEVQR
jgi:hypothetical protein